MATNNQPTVKAISSNTTDRPYESAHRAAVDRLNDAIAAMRVVKEEVGRRQDALRAIAAKYYSANPDLPRPE